MPARQLPLCPELGARRESRMWVLTQLLIPQGRQKHTTTKHAVSDGAGCQDK